MPRESRPNYENGDFYCAKCGLVFGKEEHEGNRKCQFCRNMMRASPRHSYSRKVAYQKKIELEKGAIVDAP